MSPVSVFNTEVTVSIGLKQVNIFNAAVIVVFKAAVIVIM